MCTCVVGGPVAGLQSPDLTSSAVM